MTDSTAYGTKHALEDDRPRTPAIIHRPDLAPPVKRGILAVIAASGWALWFYLIAPLLALVAWVFGYDRLQIYLLGDPKKTLYTFEAYGLIIAAAGALFLAWAIYNWMRFRRVDRRRAPPVVTTGELAMALEIEHETILTARDAQVMTFTFNNEGQVTSIIDNNLLASSIQVDENAPPNEEALLKSV